MGNGDLVYNDTHDFVEFLAAMKVAQGSKFSTNLVQDAFNQFIEQKRNRLKWTLQLMAQSIILFEQMENLNSEK